MIFMRAGVFAAGSTSAILGTLGATQRIATKSVPYLFVGCAANEQVSSVFEMVMKVSG